MTGPLPRPRKMFGQNFLTDRNVLARIVQSAGIRPGEPVLPSLGPDKFLNSDFEKMLKDKGVTTIIINGTAAQSTVLHTGGEAALRGFDVIAPVDGMSSNDPFPELYTAFHLATAARIADRTTLTLVDMISYK